MTEPRVDLSRFNPGDFKRGKSAAVEALWRVVSAVIFQSPLVPWYGLKRKLLRWFGASVGEGVIVKPRVTITMPWKLKLGDHVWIGEEAWIDNLAHVTIGDHVCLSQGAYLCTGNHDWSSKTFELRVKPIEIGAGAWVSARAVVGPGVKVGPKAVLLIGSVAVTDLEASGIYQGNPAARISTRSIITS